jgi:short-subunit dehydrogenase
MKKIAIITGATGGLGKEFVKILNKHDLDEIWAIARNKEKLQALQKDYGDKLITISMDVSDSEEIDMIANRLSKERPEVRYLINNAGIGKMGRYNEFTTKEVENMISTNCKSVTMLCTIAIPYMQKGSNILNISSQASFQPNPYLNLYAATKAFVTSYSRALNCELKKLGITVTAVCPGWVNTELLVKEWNGRKIKFPGIVEPEPVVRKAIRDAKRGKDMSVYGAYVKGMQLFSKLMPHKLGMNLWVKSIEKYD